MNEAGILFTAAMVHALPPGPKTKTRRAIHLQPNAVHEGEPYWFVGGYRVWAYRPVPAVPLRAGGNPMPCPYGQPLDRLWVRETFFAWGRWETRFNAKKGRDEWHFVDMTLDCGHAYLYTADHPRPQPLAGKRDGGLTPKWWKRPAIFMPRDASRITLEITEVRVERLQDISEADALAEGIVRQPDGGYGLADTTHYHHTDPRQSYFSLWEAINGDGSVDANPWVWAVSFRRLP